jgi:NADPH-dependent curcumin reductase CurA
MSPATDRHVNRQVILSSRPEGIPQAEHFRVIETPVPQPGPGQLLIRNHYLAVEPAMRGWVNAVANYAEPVGIGEVMRSFAAGEIVASADPLWPVGTRVTGMFGWQDYAVVAPSLIDYRVEQTDLPLSTSLGVLGINGITAHYGLLQIGQPRSGETVLVSTGAGAVGSCVGQIARLKGCRSVAITGGEAKRQLCIDRFQYDRAIDYKRDDLARELAAACPEGIDIYFDNTSGAISDEVMAHLNVGARVIICGTASIANWNPVPLGPRVERTLLVKRARMQGFVILDHRDHYAIARVDLANWVRQGLIRYEEDILGDIGEAPDAIAGLYRGENLGRRLIRLIA